MMDRELQTLLRESKELISKSQRIRERTRELIEISHKLKEETLNVTHDYTRISRMQARAFLFSQKRPNGSQIR